MQNRYINFTVNGTLFPLWILHNFKKYKLDPIVKIEGEDPCFPRKKNVDKDELQLLRNYQSFIAQYLSVNSPYKNILIYHGLGSGKTRTAINIYNVLYNSTMGAVNVFILVKAFLHKDVWTPELRRWLEEEDKEGRNRNITFIHYDSPYADKEFMTKVKEADSSKKNIYIIDEAHNFINNVYNNITNKQGTRAQKIYDYIIQDKKDNNDTRVILISGTPVINKPFELALIFNLLRANTFPTNEEKFIELYINSSGTDLNNDTKNMFQRRILGLVSYYKGTTSDLYAKENKIQVNVPMNDYQERIYKHYEAIEKKLEQNSFRGSTQSVYKSYTRQACNFVFPVINDQINGESRPRPSKFKLSDKEIEQIENGTLDEKTGDDRYKLYKDTMKKYIVSFNGYLEKIGRKNFDKDIEIFKKEYKYDFNKFYKEHKNKSELFEALYSSSCKMTAILFNSLKSEGPLVVYSNYVTMEGLEIFKIYLQQFDFVEFNDKTKDNKNKDFLRYVDFSGKVDKNIRDINKGFFNDITNKNGSTIRILLLSPAGSEGMNLRNVRQVHITEPYWQETRIIQLIGRAIRQCSHKDIPMKDRVVDVYRYNAIYSDTSINVLTTDQEIQEKSLTKQMLIESFLKTVKEAAVDCDLFKNHNMIEEKYSCFKFNQNTYFKEYYGPAYKEDEEYDIKINNGSNSINSQIKKIQVYKIKGVEMIGNNKTTDQYSKANDYLYDPLTKIVYDVEYNYPIGKVMMVNDIPVKIDRITYVIDQIIVVPKIKNI